MQATLLKDVYGNKSNGKQFPQYGSKNEIVTIISQHDNVYIVEGKSGRFPVRKECVKIITK